MTTIIGIELGTTYSTVAYVNELGQPAIMADLSHPPVEVTPQYKHRDGQTPEPASPPERRSAVTFAEMPRWRAAADGNGGLWLRR